MDPYSQNVASELTYWLANIGQYFKGGYSGSGENGVDVTLPQDTPIYAITGGQVVGSGYYAGGGVESVQAAPGQVWYYQHLDQNFLTPGQTVSPGQLIGLSGGQNVGGAHPSTPTFSSWPHIEVGVNAPWGGIWGGGQAPNVDPLPILKQLLAQQGGSNVTTLSSPTSGTTTLGNPIPGADAITGLVGIVENGFKEFIIRGSIIAVGVLLGLIGLTVILFDRENVQTAAAVARVAA